MGGQLLRLYASRCSVAVSGSGSDDGGFCGLSLSGFLWVAARAPLKGCSVSDREAPNQHAVRHNYIPLPTRRNLTPPAPSKWLVSRGNARGIIVAVWAEVIATSLFVLPRVRLDLVRGVGYVRRAQVPAYHRRGLVEVVAGGGIGLATQHAAEPHRDQGKEHTGAEPRARYRHGLSSRSWPGAASAARRARYRMQAEHDRRHARTAVMQGHEGAGGRG